MTELASVEPAECRAGEDELAAVETAAGELPAIQGDGYTDKVPVFHLNKVIRTQGRRTLPSC